MLTHPGASFCPNLQANQGNARAAEAQRIAAEVKAKEEEAAAVRQQLAETAKLEGETNGDGGQEGVSAEEGEGEKEE